MSWKLPPVPDRLTVMKKIEKHIEKSKPSKDVSRELLSMRIPTSPAEIQT